MSSNPLELGLGVPVGGEMGDPLVSDEPPLGGDGPEEDELSSSASQPAGVCVRADASSWGPVVRKVWGCPECWGGQGDAPCWGLGSALLLTCPPSIPRVTSWCCHTCHQGLASHFTCLISICYIMHTTPRPPGPAIKNRTQLKREPAVRGRDMLRGGRSWRVKPLVGGGWVGLGGFCLSGGSRRS